MVLIARIVDESAFVGATQVSSAFENRGESTALAARRSVIIDPCWRRRPPLRTTSLSLMSCWFGAALPRTEANCGGKPEGNACLSRSGAGLREKAIALFA